MLSEAYLFAAKKHKNQRRKNSNGDPYINHPIEVVYLLEEAGVSNDHILMAGVLHDTIEDTNTTYDEIRDKFGMSVADMVMECTDDKSLPKVERKKLQILKAKGKSTGAKLVKLADKLSNLSDLQHDPPKHWSSEEIRGYLVWCYCVCREIEEDADMMGTGKYLKEKLNLLFGGICLLSDEGLEAELDRYYNKIEHSE